MRKSTPDLPGRAARPSRLTRGAVLAAALAIIDRDGLPALTMRRLGKELGVEAMSLYHHVASKDDVMDGVVDLVLGAVDVPRPELGWADWARQFAREYRRIALEHPHVFPLIALRPLTTPQALRPVEMSLEVLRRAGFDGRHALAAFQTLANFTSGFALEEIAAAGGEGSPAIATLDPARFPRLHKLVDRPMQRDVAFERSLDIIIAGLALHVDGPTPRQG
ncbi:MAG: TetR/AcrR family transcriptional regulator C-terminal domain-containing protein [Actinomycetota bacterium]